jgi:hypothetical protein
VAEARQLLPGAHERILGQFLGAAAIHADQAQDRTMHATDMTAIKLLEGARVAGLGTAHQRCIVHGSRQFKRGCIHAQGGALHRAALDAGIRALV